jgi:hypothetical protein
LEDYVIKLLIRASLAGMMVLCFAATSHAWFLDFEWGLGQNWTTIGSDMPGLDFTAGGDDSWLYADISTGMYNAQNNLGDWYGSGEWFMEDQVFAWLGPHHDAGRIDFENKDGSFFTVGYNSFFDFYVEAYDEFDNLIDVAVGPPNTMSFGGDGLDFLTVTSASANIAYVKLHDHGDMWLVDNMSGDASGVDLEESQIPEPTTLLLLGTGLMAGGLIRYRFRRK